MFVRSKDDLHEKKFKINDEDYMFSKKGDNVYEIRRLSGTNNPNVIFSLKRKKNYQGNLTKEEFKEQLK